MKKRVLSLFLILLMICSIHIPINASTTIAGQYGFVTSELTAGNVQAVIKLASSEDEVSFVIGYYSSDNILQSLTSTTVSDTNMKFLSLTIPDTVSFGDYVKVMAYNKETFEPVKPQTTLARTLYCTKGMMTSDAVTYEGLYDRYYTIDSPSGSLSVNKRVVSVADEGTPFRLKDMAEGYVAFKDYTTPRYRLEYTEDNGIRVYYYSSGGAKQRWKLEEYNNGYAIAHANGGYLAISGDVVVISDEKYEWTLNFIGETPTTLMTSLDGFKLLSSQEQQRVLDICTSVGAETLPLSAISTGDSFLSDVEGKLTSIYLNRSSLTAQEEKEQILAAMSTPVMGSLVDWNTVPTYPGGDAVITQKAPVKTKHEMWDLVEENGVIYSASEEHPYTGAPINCYRIDVTYTTANSTQNVSVYCVDPAFSNVQTAINALGKFPYAYRQHIKNMYVYLSTTTATYNCGGEELFVRLTGEANESSMIKGFAHELGHSNDYMANGNVNNRASHWSQGTVWQNAVTDDVATISTYGNSNSDEGFAEFARLYWLSYGNRDLQIGIKQLYPNRFASFQRMLTKIGCESDVLY